MNCDLMSRVELLRRKNVMNWSNLRLVTVAKLKEVAADDLVGLGTL
jgi:hypothetical protein